MAASPDMFSFDDLQVTTVRESQSLRNRDQRTIACLNIGNREGDPRLCDRLEQLCACLSGEKKLDALILFEAGRPAGMKERWTSVALFIEEHTNLQYVGVQYDDATPDSSGKAVFIDRSRLIVDEMYTRYMEDYSSSNCLMIVFLPVFETQCSVKGKKRCVDTHRGLTIAALQMQEHERSRELVAYWLSSRFDDVDALFVDLNVSSKNVFNVRVPSLTRKICTASTFRHLKYQNNEGDAIPTYHAFSEHTIPLEDMPIVPAVWTKVNNNKEVLVASTSDHLFCNAKSPSKIVASQFILSTDGASDHDVVGADFIF